jgi:OOP family OmpA-OmpF porin
MKKIHNLLAVVAVTAVTAMTLSGAAHAQSTGAADDGWYGRAQLGSAKVNERSLGLKDSAGSGSVAIGYRFNPYWSAEVGLVKLGEVRSRATVGGSPANLRLEALGFTLGGAGKLPLGENGTGWFLGGRAGMAWLEGEGRVLSNDRSSVVDLKKERKARAYVGAGVGYDFSRDFGVSLNVDRYRVGDRRTADATFVSLGAEFRF